MGRIASQNPISTATNDKDRHESLQFLSEGSMVEVSNDEEGFDGAWYVAKILKSLSKQTDKFLIQYQTLLSDDDSNQLLIETADASFIRPLPPPPAADQTYEPLDVVDAFHRDGWWKGVVTEVQRNLRRIYTVVFENPPEKFEFCSQELRFHLAWIDGKWVRPPKQKRMEGLKIGKGMVVEVNLDGENLQDAWFPATVVEEVGFNSFLVEYCRSKIDGADGCVKETVDSFHIRPLPPKLDVQKFYTLEAVDVFHDSCWRNGIVSSALEDGRYIVCLKFAGKEIKFRKSEIRPHLLWMNGRWVIPNKLQYDRSSVKKSRKNQLEQSTRKKLKKSVLGETLVNNSSKKFRKEKFAKPLSAKEYCASLMSMKSTAQWPNRQETGPGNGIAEESRRKPNAQVRGHQVAAAVGEVKRNADLAEITNGVNNDLAIKMEFEDHPSGEAELPTVRSMEPQGDRDGNFEKLNRSLSVTKDQEIPFKKSSFLWQYLDSLRVFQFLPQNPHFRPLLECNEASREESAIGHMLKFVNLVEKASKLEIENPVSVYENCLKGLADLELLGFDVEFVVDGINELLSSKRWQEHLYNQWKQIHGKIEECDGERAKLMAEIDEIDSMIGQLEEQRAMRVLRKVKEDSKSEFLQVYASTIRDGMFDVKQKFKNKAAAFNRYL